MANNTATVQTLTAQVEVLSVGRRQVTLSVYRQLDVVAYDEIEPFGRVNDSRMDPAWLMECYGISRPVIISGTWREPRFLWIIGRHRHTGKLVRGFTMSGQDHHSYCRHWNTEAVSVMKCPQVDQHRIWEAEFVEAKDLDLIVLAGLK